MNDTERGNMSSDLRIRRAAVEMQEAPARKLRAEMSPLVLPNKFGNLVLMCPLCAAGVTAIPGPIRGNAYQQAAKLLTEKLRRHLTTCGAVNVRVMVAPTEQKAG